MPPTTSENMNNDSSQMMNQRPLSIAAFGDDNLCSKALSEDLDLFDGEGALDWDISDKLDPEFWLVVAEGGLLNDTMIRTTATDTKVQPSSQSEANPTAISHAGSPLFTNQDETAELATFTTPQVDVVASDPHVPSQLEFIQDNAKLRSDRPGLESSRPDHPTSKGVPQEESPALNWAESHLAQADEEAKASKVTPSGKRDPRTARAVKIRMANPKMPLEDVLLKAGYMFDFEDENGRPIDADNISLRQRKNHLCRMVRKEKQRRRRTAPF